MKSKPFVLLPLLAVAFSVLFTASSHAQTAPAKTVVSGKFLGDGKDGKLQYLVVQNREAFSDQAAIRLVFTEKNSASSDKPDFDAVFKKLGSALILSVFKDGGIFGCEVAHTAHEKSPFTDLGKIAIKDFVVTDTQVSGHVITPGELDAFGQKWEVDLTFSAPLPKGAFAAVAEEPKKADKVMEKEETEVTGPKLPVGKLPLPATARNVDYKQTVEHIVFSADGSVSAVANDFSAKLKKQGWKEGSGSLISKTSAILMRKLNGAELTIMIKPADAGCTVQIFTEGLDWSEPPAFTEKPTPAPDATPTSSDTSTPTPTETTKPAEKSEKKGMDANTKRLLNDALKKIPKGF